MIAPVDFDRHYHLEELPGRAPRHDQVPPSVGPDGAAGPDAAGQVDRVRKLVGQYPTVAIVLGTAIGLAAGWLIKRRAK